MDKEVSTQGVGGPLSQAKKTVRWTVFLVPARTENDQRSLAQLRNSVPWPPPHLPPLPLSRAFSGLSSYNLLLSSQHLGLGTNSSLPS